MEENTQKYIAKGLMLIHGPETRDEFLMLLKATGRPAKVLGHACVVVLTKIDAAINVAGRRVLDQARIAGAMQFLKELSDVAEAAKLFQVGDAEIELALSYTIQEYVKAEASAGRLDMAKLQAEVQKGISQMSPKDRRAMSESMARIQKTAQQGAQA